MASRSMAGELLHMLTPYNYSNTVIHLTMKDIVTQKVYPRTMLNDTHWLDTRQCYFQRWKNLQQLFEVFATFNEEEPKQVCKKIISRIKEEYSFYNSLGSEHLCKIKMTLDEWIELMASDNVLGDELMVYALSRTYQRHTPIITNTICWMTIGSDEPISDQRLLELCEVKLLYIGLHMFGELKLKPFGNVKQQAVTEALSSILPNTSDDMESTQEDSPKVIDLSKPHENKETSDDETIDGDPSISSDIPAILSSSESKDTGLTSPVQHTVLLTNIIETDNDSDTPSESLISPAVTNPLDADRVQGLNKENTPDSKCAVDHVSLGRNSRSVTFDITSTNTNNNAMLGINGNVKIMMGTNSNVLLNNMEQSALGINTKSPEGIGTMCCDPETDDTSKTDTLTLTQININDHFVDDTCSTHRNDTDCADYIFDAYQDAVLSGALECLNPAESCVVNILTNLATTMLHSPTR